MTTTEQINDLITRHTDLLDYIGKKYEADLDRFQALEADAEQLTRRSFYVAAHGSDDAAGTVNDPLQTISEAVRRSVYAGVLIVILQTDYHWADRPERRTTQMVIRSDNQDEPRQITFADRVTDTWERCPGFQASPGVASIEFRDVNFHLRKFADHISSVATFTVAGLLNAYFNRCVFSVADDANQVMFPNGFGGVSIYVANCTIPDEMGGHWMAAVSAGTTPDLVSEITGSNLVQL